MNDHTYLERMLSLTEQLDHAAGAEPHDQEAFDKVLEAFHRTNLV